MKDANLPCYTAQGFIPDEAKVLMNDHQAPFKQANFLDMFNVANKLKKTHSFRPVGYCADHYGSYFHTETRWNVSHQSFLTRRGQFRNVLYVHTHSNRREGGGAPVSEVWW